MLLDQIAEIRVGSGVGIDSIAPQTVVESFRQAVEKWPTLPALKQLRSPSTTEWQTWTWAEYHQQIQLFAAALISK